MVEADFSVYEFRKERIGLRMKLGLFASETLPENLQTVEGLGMWRRWKLLFDGKVRRRKPKPKTDVHSIIISQIIQQLSGTAEVPEYTVLVSLFFLSIEW